LSGEARVQQRATQPPPSSTALKRFEEKLGAWRDKLTPAHFVALEAHLAHFLGDEEELREEGIKPSLASFDDLLQFLATHPWAKAPAAALDKQGNWALAWSPNRGAKANLIMTFMGENRVKLYHYDATGPEGRPLHGVSVVDLADVDDVLKAFHLVEWMAA
jgi:hypothetical protein